VILAFSIVVIVCSLFLTLPEDFKLPEIERRVVPPEERR